MEYQGIDVSKWQKSIDWKKVKNSGVDFAMVRASYGTNGVDDYFKQNMTAIESAGLDKGVYHYSYALSPDAARREAQHFLDTIKGYKITYPVALDLEDASIGNFSKQNITEIALAFLESIEQGGYYATLYTSLDWVKNRIDMSKLTKYDLWLAQWGDGSPTYSGKVGLWQYSNQGNVIGVNGMVDMNKSYQNYPDLIAKNGLNHLNVKLETWQSVTLDESITLLREKALLEDQTIQFLKAYQYSDVLIRKLGAAIKK